MEKPPIVHAVTPVAIYIRTNVDTVCGLRILDTPGDIYIGQPVTCEACKATVGASHA